MSKESLCVISDNFLLFVVDVLLALGEVDYAGIINSRRTGNNPAGNHLGSDSREE